MPRSLSPDPRSPDELGYKRRELPEQISVEVVANQILTDEEVPGRERLAGEITRIGRFICELYDLHLELDGGDFLVSKPLYNALFQFFFAAQRRRRKFWAFASFVNDFLLFFLDLHDYFCIENSHIFFYLRLLVSISPLWTR